MAGSSPPSDHVGLASTQLKVLDAAVHAEPANRHTRVGAIVADKYRVERVLGEGGMGIVVAVTHLQLKELFALKFLLPELAREPEVVARFMREAEAAARIKNEHIARVTDVGQLPDGSAFLVMEHLTGEDVSKRLHENGPLPIVDAIDIVLQACDAVIEAHELGFIHRDLKPANLFLTKRANGSLLVKVLDFGISKAVSDTGDASITTTHQAFGSPAYMSPEQIRSARNVDTRTDIWALGVILHELLTGELPFDGNSAAALFAAVSADPPRPVRAVRPEVGADLEATILRCLEKNRDARFQSVAELASAIAPFGSNGAAVTRFAPPQTSFAPAAPVSQASIAPNRSLLYVAVAVVGIGTAVVATVAALGLKRAPAVVPAAISAETASAEAAPPKVVEAPAVVVAASAPTPSISAVPAAKPRPGAPKRLPRSAAAPSASGAAEDPTSTSH